MLRTIDHLVVVVRNLADASDDFASAGFTVTPGGEHVDGATHNALVTFADGTYFELIAFKEPERPQSHKWWPRLALGEGLTDYALGSDDVRADAEAIRQRGLAVHGPVDGGRLRPDGIRLEWRTILLGRGAAAALSRPTLPFVIEDVTPRELRVPGGAAARHRLPASRVAGLTLLTANLQDASAAMTALLGSEGRRTIPSTGKSDRASLFGVGDQWLEIVQPATIQTPAGQHLVRFGEGPYEIVLAGSASAQPGSGDLIAANLHGTRIRVSS